MKTDRKKYEIAYLDYKNGMKYKDIALKYNVTLNAVKSWKMRYWSKYDEDIDSNGLTKEDIEERLKEDLKEDATEEEVEKVSKISTSVRVRPKADNGKLTEDQKMFCVNYVACWNMTQAYLKTYPDVTYKQANRNAYKLMLRPEVKDEIKRISSIVREHSIFDPISVMQKYVAIANADIGDYLEFGTEMIKVYDDDGNEQEIPNSFVRLKDSSKVDTSLIKKVKKGKDGSIEIELHDAMKAMEWLSKFTKLSENKDLMELQKRKLELEIEQLEKNNGKNNLGNLTLNVVDEWQEGEIIDQNN